MAERKKPNLAQYCRETVLDAEQCAEWLGVHVDFLEQVDIPAVRFGQRFRRYVVGEVLDFFDRQIRRVA